MLHTLYGQAMKHDVQFFGAPAERSSLCLNRFTATPIAANILHLELTQSMLRMLCLVSAAFSGCGCFVQSRGAGDDCTRCFTVRAPASLLQILVYAADVLVADTLV